MDDGFLADEQDHQHDERVSSCGFHVKGEVAHQKLNDSWMTVEFLRILYCSVFLWKCGCVLEWGGPDS